MSGKWSGKNERMCALSRGALCVCVCVKRVPRAAKEGAGGKDYSSAFLVDNKGYLRTLLAQTRKPGSTFPRTGIVLRKLVLQYLWFTRRRQFLTTFHQTLLLISSCVCIF